MFVRLKRYNPRRGYVMRKYTHMPSGKKFEETSGWYKVNTEVAESLRDIHQRPRDEESPLAFDVCTQAEAEAIDALERKEQTRREAHGANDLTTGTLRRGNDGPSPELTPVDERRQARAARIQPGTLGTRSMRAVE